ncbi:MAG: NifB/NifX family molybdenum-iron cluster-binding protein [Synergistales bacterium]|nr:NifB/NifX family molybdenum-iron cluster-binding protein [Synergistales bacterium]
MRVAIAAENGEVAAHFGRAPYYVFADIEEGRVVSTWKEENPGHAPGAIPRWLSDEGAQWVLARGMGRKACAVFEQLGIETFVGVGGTVEEAVEAAAAGRIVCGESSCSHGETGHEH